MIWDKIKRAMARLAYDVLEDATREAVSDALDRVERDYIIKTKIGERDEEVIKGFMAYERRIMVKTIMTKLKEYLRGR